MLGCPQWSGKLPEAAEIFISPTMKPVNQNRCSPLISLVTERGSNKGRGAKVTGLSKVDLWPGLPALGELLREVALLLELQVGPVLSLRRFRYSSKLTCHHPSTVQSLIHYHCRPCFPLIYLLRAFMTSETKDTLVPQSTNFSVFEHFSPWPTFLF